MDGLEIIILNSMDPIFPPVDLDVPDLTDFLQGVYEEVKLQDRRAL